MGLPGGYFTPVSGVIYPSEFFFPKFPHLEEKANPEDRKVKIPTWHIKIWLWMSIGTFFFRYL